MHQFFIFYYRYWPYDTQPVYYGDIQVTIMNESLFPDWNVTEFRMMRGNIYRFVVGFLKVKMDCNVVVFFAGDAVRSIRHFHFTTWPDFGVPEPPQVGKFDCRYGGRDLCM